MAGELTEAGVAELSRRIERREISPVELADACLARIERLDLAIGAFVEITSDRVRVAAREAEREIMAGRRLGPLHGIPVGIKDIVDVQGYRTTCGSRLLSNNVATRNAASVDRLLAAGAIVLGKTATYEFATGGPSFDLPWPPTRNPWNLDHGSGGSSTGSAASVAACMVPLAVGSDTGGSIRVPASYCGLTGLKPSYGLVDTAGVWPLAPSFDTVGLLCRSADDAAIGFGALTGNGVTLIDGLRGLRIGLARSHYDGARAELVQAIDEAVVVLRNLGAIVEDATLPDLDDYGTCSRAITAAEAFAVHRDALVEDPDVFGEMFRYRVLPGALVQGADYVAAQWLRRKLIEQTLAPLERFDVLLSASTLGPAPAFATMSYGGRLKPFPTIAFSLTGLPAISICCGFAPNGLPLSLQIVGRPQAEATILGVAHAYQGATDWHRRRPALDPDARSTSRMPDWSPAEIREDPAVDRLIDACLALHGLRLSDRQCRQLREGAASVLRKAVSA
ncbi:MAG: amidase [Rhodospirillaceae bacterium]|nr:amidase [Rhodospirillaceae bacterium]